MTLLGNRKTHEKLVDRTSSPTDILRREPIAPACVSYYARKTIEDAVCCLIHIWLEQKEAKGCMKKKNKVLKQNIEYLSLAQRGRESRSCLQSIIKCKYSLTNSFELNLDMWGSTTLTKVTKVLDNIQLKWIRQLCLTFPVE